MARAAVLSVSTAAATAAFSADFTHPTAGDPYAGYKRADGNTSCCGGRDCVPVPWNDRVGELRMPGGLWLDPRRYVNQDNTKPAIYFSFDGRAHACVSSGRLVCAFIPGAAADAGAVVLGE